MQVNKMQVLYNPFTYIAGIKSLLISIVVVACTAWLCFITGTHNYGLVNINFASDTIFAVYFLEHFIHWITAALILFCFGILFSKSSIRMIDVFGTQGIARSPLIILPVVRLIPAFKSFPVNSPNMYVLFVLHVAMVVWCVALMFHGYKISCNVKAPRLIGSFIAGLFLSEIVARMFIYFLLTL